MESCFSGGKKPNSAKTVLINFLAQKPPDRGENTYFCKSYKNEVVRVFWQAEFISTLKTEPNRMVSEKSAKNKTKYIYILFFFCDFL